MNNKISFFLLANKHLFLKIIKILCLEFHNFLQKNVEYVICWSTDTCHSKKKSESSVLTLTAVVGVYLAGWIVAGCTLSGMEILAPGGWHRHGCGGWVWQEAALPGGKTFPWSLKDTNTDLCQCNGLHFDRGFDRSLQKGKEYKISIHSFLFLFLPFLDSKSDISFLMTIFQYKHVWVRNLLINMLYTMNTIMLPNNW